MVSSANDPRIQRVTARISEIEPVMKYRLSTAFLALATVAGCAPDLSADRIEHARQRLDSTSGLAGWTEQQLAVPVDDPGTFAKSLGIFGNFAVVSSSEYAGSGAIFTYTRENSVWTPLAPPLYPPPYPAPPATPQAVARFGTTLAVSPDFLAVSGSTTASGLGSVWVFARENTGWSANGQLLQPTVPQSSFGRALALEGTTLLVGAPSSDGTATDNSTLPGQGAVYPYSYNATSKIWESRSALRPSGDDTAGARFGASIALGGDLLAIGAPSSDSTGSIRSFVRTTEFTLILGW